MCKMKKGATAVGLLEYFKELAEVCEHFHEKSYRFEPPRREEAQTNPIIHIGLQLKEGLNGLYFLRRDVGNEHCRLQKLIKATIIPKIEKTI